MVDALIGLVLVALPLVTVPIPWSTIPVLPENTAVNFALLPLLTTVGLATKLVIDGRGTSADFQPAQFGDGPMTFETLPIRMQAIITYLDAVIEVWLVRLS